MASGDADKPEDAGRAERRLQLLLTVSGELVAAQTNEDVARILIESGIAAVGASYGGLWLLESDSHLKLLGVSQLPRGSIDRWTTVPVELDAPLPQAVRDGQPIFLDSLALYEQQFPASFTRIRETLSSADLAYAILPVTANGTPIGGIAITYERAGVLDANERAFLTILAGQCGAALARIRVAAELARAYREEQQAHQLALQATHAREEILSVVSHDLRNPLGTILMGAATLLQLADPDDAKSQRVHVVAERIHRQSERMARLIEDLVDYAGIQAGKLAIVRTPCSPDAIIARAAELLGPLATERAIAFEAKTTPGLPPLPCDFDRAVQVLSNLLGNAVKVTTRRGQITIGTRDEAGETVFFVSDTGPGIDADERPRIFERYWRSKQSTYKGAGLGLAIAKAIVDAHEGRIWAESPHGVGITFCFTLAPKL
jgi:signal transduction histidine kinase